MRHTRSVAGLAIATMVLAGLGVAGAMSASAADDGPAQVGSVYLFNNHKNLATATAADQVTGGTTYAGKPFTTVAVDGACPANTAQVQMFVRLKDAPTEAQWGEYPLGSSDVYQLDAKGHAYLDTPEDNFSAGLIQNSLGGTTKVLPLAFVCEDAGAVALGYFATDLSIAPTATPAWSQVTVPKLPGGGGTTAVDTTTTLAAAAQGANLALTATVAPTVADGSVTFTEGTTTIGTADVVAGKASVTVTAPAAGDHTYKASFTPKDATKYKTSATEGTFTVTKAADGTVTVTLTVPAPQGEPGTVTIAVPAASSVALTGQRDTGNTRVTASADLPTITVTDTHRADLQTAWQVNVQSTDFTGGSTTIGAKYLGLKPSVPSTSALTGPATVVQAGAQVASNLDSADSKGLSQAQALGTVTTKGQGTTTLGGRLDLAVPGATTEGTYTSVITVTLIGG